MSQRKRGGAAAPPTAAFFTQPGLFHRSDPITSIAAATDEGHVVRWGSMRWRLLAAFYQHGLLSGLTDEEAGTLADVGGYNEKRRCSELRKWGLIVPSDRTRPTRTGAESMVCHISDAGRRLYRQIIQTP